MRLQEIYARFYRSLNYDYLRASHEGYKAAPWDSTPSGADYPFVRLRLEPDITTVVGGNESGKSQVLRAIKAALTGTGYNRSDFCRYSTFFGRDAKMVEPEFGAVFTDITTKDIAVAREMTDADLPAGVSRIAMFRMNTTYKFRIYVEADGVWSEPYNVKKSGLTTALGVPALTVIDADVPLPNSIPWDYLVTGKATAGPSRDIVTGFFERFNANIGLFANAATVQNSANEIATLFGTGTTESVDAKTIQQYELGADLLFKVARIEREQVAELQRAIKDQNGYASSLVDSLNEKIAKALNFPHWWSQDSQFELVVSALDLEFHLQFEIRDRTEKSYSFDAMQRAAIADWVYWQHLSVLMSDAIGATADA